MRCFKTSLPVSLPILLLVLFCHVRPPRACAELLSMTSSKDNTLYEYDPADPQSPLNSNGSGDFFSAGRNRSRSLIRRGLIQFDLSSIPTGAVVVPATAALTLEVIDMPKRDTTGESRDFWLVRLDRDWGEGASEANAGVSGAGSGAPAMEEDATWLHTMYDPAIHDPRNPNPVDPGYWPQEGALGNVPLDPTVYGDPAGTVPAAPYLGPVTFALPAMEADINAWVANPTSNFGWIVLGDERIGDSSRSSNRGFASGEHADHPPLLTFEYTIVPEPSSVVLLVMGLGVLWWRWPGIIRHRRSPTLPRGAARRRSPAGHGRPTPRPARPRRGGSRRGRPWPRRPCP